MSKLSKFIGVSEEVEIRGEKIKLFPITVKDMNIFDRISEISKIENKTEEDKLESTKLFRDLIRISYSEENFTDEEIEKMDVTLFSELISKIIERVYELKDDGGKFARIRELKEKVISEQKQSG